ncbi:hypothetical protein HAX54_049809 [Datura stramonium]|uniref:Uncharacterized protein n=1 Tax=Datura stramonium TaxID=4076 RepID=A0ABS8SW85_DATST|nr:hypothetical protein [Datura stramonium]
MQAWDVPESSLAHETVSGPIDHDLDDPTPVILIHAFDDVPPPSVDMSLLDEVVAAPYLTQGSMYDLLESLEEDEKSKPQEDAVASPWTQQVSLSP